MKKPNLNRMWATFIRLSDEDILLGKHIEKMRSTIYPLVSRLKDGGLIDWYCLLIHIGPDQGVPTTPDDKNPYLHLRVAFTKDLSEDEVKRLLPTDLPKTSPINISEDQIRGIHKNLLKNEDIAEAWRIIGESTEWMFNMINVFKTDESVYPELYNPTLPEQCQIWQFLHYYRCALQIQIT